MQRRRACGQKGQLHSSRGSLLTGNATRLSIRHARQRTKADVVGLQLLDRRGLGVGQDDGGEALSRGGEGAVVDAGDAGAEREREARLGVGDGHVVEHHAFEVPLALSGAIEAGELLLLDCKRDTKGGEQEARGGGRERAAAYRWT